MGSRSGRYAMFEQLRLDGIRFVFGNPGTVEQGFLDSLQEFPDIQYINTLQETIAVAIADGYARATKAPAIVQLHSGVGLGNGIGMMYQAKRGNAPLVVIAGESGLRYDAMDAQMAADLVGMARPVTKWATRVVDPHSVLRILRRAIKIASTPPMGPVFVALPMDVLDAPNDEEPVRTPRLLTRVAPDPEGIALASEWLAAAEHPMIIAGDGIAASGAQAELESVADILGAEVWGCNNSEVNISAANPLYRGDLGHMFGDSSRPITSKADAVLICGTYVFPEVFPALEGVFAPHAKVVHVDLDTYEIAKNFPVDLGVLGDPKTALRDLATALSEAMAPVAEVAARRRKSDLAALREREREAQLQADRAVRDDVPLEASRFMEELARNLPSDAMVFDEALTVSPALTRYLPPTLPGRFFQTRGGSLGVGIPGAIGLKLAHPESTVFGFTGDGGSMYTIQALWTAAHHKVGAKFVICNNGSYRLLKLNILQYWRERGIEEHSFPPSFDLTDPDIRFDDLARSMGVPAARVERPEQVGPAIKEALATDGPFLIDLVLTAQSSSGGLSTTAAGLAQRN